MRLTCTELTHEDTFSKHTLRIVKRMTSEDAPGSEDRNACAKQKVCGWDRDISSPAELR